MAQIPLHEFVFIKNLTEYKLHLACWNGYNQPLDLYVEDFKKWIAWNEWMGGKNDFNRKYIFALIHYYHEPKKWLFGGIFEIKKRHLEMKYKEGGYEVELQSNYKNFIGRLIVDYQRKSGRGRAFRLERYYDKFIVSEVLKNEYTGESFCGFENINHDFTTIESIIKTQKLDWKGALENIKGIYLIIDKSNGKKYIGSAYGDSGIWSRWTSYIQTGHGWNDELTAIIKKEGIEYARRNFKFSLLEYHSTKTDDSIILGRESYWKEVLLSRGKFGYNKN